MTARWKQRPEGGGWFAIWLIRNIARYGGRAVGRALLYPITLYFLLRRAPERRASRAYLARALGRPARLLDGARHIHTLRVHDPRPRVPAQRPAAIVRRHASAASRKCIASSTNARACCCSARTWAASKCCACWRANARTMSIRVVLDKGHNPAMTQLLDALNPQIAANVIDAGQDGPSIVLAIQQAVAAGHLVALLVDRAQPGEAALPAELPRPRRAVPDRALADRAVLQHAGGAGFRPVPRRQPLRPGVRAFQRRPARAAGAARRRCWRRSSAVTRRGWNITRAKPPTTGSTSMTSGNAPMRTPTTQANRRRAARAADGGAALLATTLLASTAGWCAAPDAGTAVDAGWILSKLARPAPMRTGFVETARLDAAEGAAAHLRRIPPSRRRHAGARSARAVCRDHHDRASGASHHRARRQAPRTFSLSRVPELAGPAGQLRRVAVRRPRAAGTALPHRQRAARASAWTLRWSPQ